MNHCYFFVSRSQFDDFTHLRPGTIIAVEGTIERLNGYDVKLKKVRLVAVEDQPV
jgi:hypothetical protein